VIKFGGRRNPRKTIFVASLFVPTFAILLVVVAYPMVRAFLLSLSRYQLLRPGENGFIGLGNYIALFKDEVFWVSLKNTMIFNVFTVAGGFLIGFGLSFLLSRNVKVKSFFRGILLTPWVVPYVVIGFLFLYMFNVKIGIINYTLKQLGVVSEFINWFTNGNYAMAAVIIASVWNQFPFHLSTSLAGQQTIPDELIESAHIDGASGWNVFWRIKLPWLRNMIVISTTLMMIQNFNNFAIIWTMTEGGPVNATNIFVIYVYKKAFVEWSFGYASAVGVIWLFILVAFAYAYMRLVEQQLY
jgi:multiple sugar transport system permease protein